MLDICLIIAGLAVVAVSFFAFEKFDEKQDSLEDGNDRSVEVWSAKEEQRVKERVSSLLEEKTEEAMERTEESLKALSNEKIMAVTELSDQVLEQINKNHSEVVFLYDMLNEKDNEIKELINDIDKSKAEAEDVAKKAVGELRKILKGMRQMKEKAAREKGREGLSKQKTAMDLLEESRKVKQTVPDKVQPEQVPEDSFVNKAQEEKSQDETLLETKISQDENRDGTPERKTVPEPEKPAVLSLDTAKDNQNNQILKLYDDGKSIVEIAKSLSLGQGEVKLVIDLFQGARGSV